MKKYKKLQKIYNICLTIFIICCLIISTIYFVSSLYSYSLIMIFGILMIISVIFGTWANKFGIEIKESLYERQKKIRYNICIDAILDLNLSKASEVIKLIKGVDFMYLQGLIDGILYGSSHPYKKDTRNGYHDINDNKYKL